MNDPCDNLSDGLTEILLLNVRLDRMTPEQRRRVSNSAYGKFGGFMALPYEEYARLVRPSLEKIWSKSSPFTEYKGRAWREQFETEYPRDPSVTITPKPGGIHHVKYDNPISPRTWTLDAS